MVRDFGNGTPVNIFIRYFGDFLAVLFLLQGQDRIRRLLSPKETKLTALSTT